MRAGQGVLIERRGTKAGHRYSLLGHALGGAVTVEPYLITLQEEAAPYVGFRHDGVEFIYMLTGEVIYRHADQSYRLTPGDAMLFDSAALPRAGNSGQQAHDLPVNHHPRPPDGMTQPRRQSQPRPDAMADCIRAQKTRTSKGAQVNAILCPFSTGAERRPFGGSRTDNGPPHGVDTESCVYSPR